MSANLVGFIIIFIILNTGLNVNGRFVVEKESIRVLSPYKLRSQKHDAAIGDFGVPEYGGSMVGSVVYPHQNSYACKPFDDQIKQPFKTNSTRLHILLLDRGGMCLCIF